MAIVQPVYLSGATITNVTLHNAARVRELNLKVGDEIEVIRSGEVIPKFLSLTHATAGQAAIPSDCPSCSSLLTFDGVRLLCTKDACEAKQSGAILHWIRAVGIENLSEKRLQNLIKLEMADHPADLYRLSVADLCRLPLTKEKMAKKLFQSIQDHRSVPLIDFLVALNIGGIGRSMWALVVGRWPEISKICEATWEDIAEIDGFAERSARQVVEGLIARRGDIERLLAAGVEILASQPQKVSSQGRALAGQVFVITGSFDRPRSELVRWIESHGGQLASSVSKKTTALVIADRESTSTKARKARELGIQMLAPEELERWLERGC